MSNKPHILCVECRGLFTDQETEHAMCCPRCGSDGVPADTNDAGTATLTRHEWRVLCMWAFNYADSIKDGCPRSLTTINAIINELKRQMPDIGALTLAEELKDVANMVNGTVEYTHNGTSEVIKPETKQ